ncbi:IS66 Orf2 like protein [Stieleria maiorica]|uniref:IS66 Orf2 like protein n=1 Tax=Stieleria maiorica TaxID=2795974 RepID=A0A5B9M9V9_9BACT|nr:IS66 family insertion sequence element accessory protein TnpB [Stieleria maiorica]QEF97898.1 IS66 Orf2 like protein [Stieleria maiorica]
MIALAPTTRIFVYTEATDMRKSFNGLSGLVKEHFQVDLFSGHLFVFFNRRRDYVKTLMWDCDGLALWSKRLESGSFEKIVSKEHGSFEIDSAGLVMMLRGVQIEGSQRRKRYSIDRPEAA